MQNDVEAIPEEIRENVVIDAMQKAIEEFETAFHQQLTAESMMDYGLIASAARKHLAHFLVNCGFGEALARMIDVIDDLAAMKTADVPDKALKRTIIRLCKDHEIKLVDMRELAETLLPEEDFDIQAAFNDVESRFNEAKQEYELAVKLSHQYQEMKVPSALKRKFEATREAYNAFLEEHPEFAS